MVNRNYKIDGEDIRETITKAWNLSITEKDALDSFIEVLKAGDLGKLKLVTSVLKEDWDYVLDRIPDSEIESYAEHDLDMETSKTIDDFEDSELLEEVRNRGLDTEETTNLKDDTDREELLELFFSKPWVERDKILKQLKNE